VRLNPFKNNSFHDNRFLEHPIADRFCGPAKGKKDDTSTVVYLIIISIPQ